MKTQASLLAAHVVPRCSLPSPELQAHPHDTNRQSLPYTHLPSPRWLRGRVGGTVVAGAVGRPMPTSSWGPHFDSKDEAGAARAVSRSCRCLPPVFPPSQAWGGIGCQLPEVQDPTQAQSMSISWTWSPPPHGSSFACQAGNVTPSPLPPPLVAHSNSCPCPATCFLSAKVGPGCQSSMARAPE